MRERRALTGFILLLVLSQCGCSVFRRIGGPKLDDPADLPASSVDFEDLRSGRGLRFLVFGDAGTGKEHQRRVAEHMGAECSTRGGCDFALMLGDNIYEVGVRGRSRRGRPIVDPRFEEKFERPYRSLGDLPFWVVTGNHDTLTRGSVEAQIAYTQISSRWRMPATDYAVPGLPEWIRIYALDTTRLVKGRDDGQLDRAADHLCAGDGWRLLMCHHPVYSSGRHAGSDGEVDAVRDRLFSSLIERCGVHLVLSGHDHHQEHLSAPMFDQIVQGAAARLRRVREVEGRRAGVRQLAAASLFGFAVIEATPERLEVRFFGYGKDEPYRNFHCRVFDRSTFGDPEQRSRDCPLY